MRLKYNIRNFGILEIILSVALLAAFSVYVLQLFVTASNNNKKMVLQDSAMYNAVTAIEQFKNGETPFAAFGISNGETAINDYYKQASEISKDLTREIEIKKDSENLAGKVYIINVNITKTGGAESVVTLSGTKFFPDRNGVQK